MTNVNIITNLVGQKDYSALVEAINLISNSLGTSATISSTDDPGTDLSIPEVFAKLDAGHTVSVCGKINISNIIDLKVTISSETSNSEENVLLPPIATAIVAYYNEYLFTKAFLTKFLRPAMFINNKIDHVNGQPILIMPKVDDYDTVEK